MNPRPLLLGQGAYYAATGIWPLVHMRSFEAVTGPKVDDWLVKTVGILVTVIGGTLLFAGLRRRSSREVALLATSSAAGLGAIDVVYALRGRIAPIYLADAVLEAGLLALWGRPTRCAAARTAPSGRGPASSLPRRRPSVSA